MTTQQTLSIIKPDAVGGNHIGEIIARFEKKGLQVVAAKMLQMSSDQAKGFYDVHKDRPFFQELVDFMISGPCLVMVLEGENAVNANRDVMGATNFKEALDGTIRKDFAKDIMRNAVHGSDSLENAKKEIEFFFKSNEITVR